MNETLPIPLLTRRELAKQLNVSLRTVVSWDRAGLIPRLRAGKVVRYVAADVIEALTHRPKAAL